MSQLYKNIYTCFPGGKCKAVTLSFDDGRAEDRPLVELLNRYGLKCTFNLNAGVQEDERYVPRAEYKALYAGHEVACHVLRHPAIARCPIEQVARQILADREALEELVDYPVRGMAYPYGHYSREILTLLPALGIRHGRTVNETQRCQMPEDFLEWNPSCHFQHGLLPLAKRFRELRAPQQLSLLYVWGHSYELPQNDGWAVMEQFCRELGGAEDVWFCTNIQLVDCMEAARALRFTARGDLVENPGAAPVWLSVDGELVEIPGGSIVRL